MSRTPVGWKRGLLDVRRVLLGGFVCAAAVAVGASGVGATPISFRLVFDGHHGPPLGDNFRHEGSFTASAPFCASGAVVDIQHAGLTATRLHTCADGSGTVTIRVSNYPEEHATGGTGSWRILDGTGAYATLRGKGSWTTVPIGGDDAAFTETLSGIAGLDNIAPTIEITRAVAKKLPHPVRAYRLTLGLAARDNDAQNAVTYSISASAGGNVWSKTGRTTTGTAVASIVFRAANTVHRVQLRLTADDPLDNEQAVSRTLELPVH